MTKLFAAAATLLAFATVATALTAQHLGHQNSTAAVDTSVVEARQQVVNDVIEGRTQLLEAAASFRDFNRQTPALAEYLAEVYSGDSEGDQTCQQLLAHVRVELQERSKPSDKEPSTEAPSDSTGVLSRLQAEFEGARSDDGKVHLRGQVN